MAETMGSITDIEMIYCDLDPDSRRQTESILSSVGLPVLATGNPQIASSLIDEKRFTCLILCFQGMDLALACVAAHARRVCPHTAIVIVFNGRDTANQAANSVCTAVQTAELADRFLLRPTAHELLEALSAVVPIERRYLASTA